MFKVINNSDAAPWTQEQRQEVMSLMLEDYERVIFYLLRKLGKDLEEITVNMRQGNEMYDFKIKRPMDKVLADRGMIVPAHVHAIEYTEEI